MRSARQQNKDLQEAQIYINALLSADSKKEPTRASPINPSRTSPIKDFNLKARFSDPPAPPPQQPLPEKPDAASSLRRSDTERPKTGSPVRSDAQTSALTEALSSAKKELESQSIRLRDLEAMLNEERRAREDAEERADRLERETVGENQDQEDHHINGTIRGGRSDGVEEEEKNSVLESGSASPGAADTTARLQQRLELMVTEMNEMKQQMERYRERAETAEADRTSLAEMIESIRRDNAKAANKSTRRSRSNSQLANGATGAGHDRVEDDNNAEEGEITIIRDHGLDDDGTEEILRRASATNGHAVEHEGDKTSAKSSNALVARRNDRPDYMHYGGPVGAMVTVVAIGVAVMAMLNQYPKTDR